MPGTSRLAQPMAAELVRRLAPLQWDGLPNQSSGTVRSGPAGPRSLRVGVPFGVPRVVGRHLGDKLGIDPLDSTYFDHDLCGHHSNH